MQKIIRLIFAIGLALATVLLAVPTRASTTSNHTWVSSTGTDNTTCGNPATPCATFQGAYSNTATSGEITCLGSGNFGGVEISRSITINCEYAIGSTLQLNAGQNFLITGLGVTVVLRGLDIDALADLGQSGNCNSMITFTGSGVLHIQKVKINHNSNCDGVGFVPSGTASLTVSDSDITDNGTSGVVSGIYIQPQSSGVQVNVAITRTQVQSNYFGIVADGTLGGIIRGTISDSVVSGNVNNGITVSSTGSNVVLLVDQTKVSGNNYGLVASGSNAGMLVSNSTVANNATGLFTSGGGVLYSYGNNRVNANTTTDGAFTSTVGLK